MPQQIETKRANAAKLVEERAKRTDEEQLASLDQKLGKGQGAAKERARLTARIAARKPEPPKAEIKAEESEKPKKKAKERNASKKKEKVS